MKPRGMLVQTETIKHPRNITLYMWTRMRERPSREFGIVLLDERVAEEDTRASFQCQLTYEIWHDEPRAEWQHAYYQDRFWRELLEKHYATYVAAFSLGLSTIAWPA